MSPHVVPKAKPSPDTAAPAEEESTATESAWEDEASTTVEKEEAIERLRPLQKPIINATTSTGNTHTGALDDHTVDDQHARAVLSSITPIRPELNARLVITQGNDAGQEIEIRPGKTYTIGRAIDNDVVLTDISVSRKHFDVKYEDGAWIIVDRGSGNGTVVNGNLEDNPFMLASGDVIEIGNTTFRYDNPNSTPRPSAQTYELEEEELSTVAGKPMRELDSPPAPAMPRISPRPKTLPPPPPGRGANPAPVLGAFAGPGAPQPASTLPLPQMANRPPLAGPSVPTLLGDAMGLPGGGLPGVATSLPTTLPGHATMRPSYPYPQATEIPPHSVHAQLLQIQAQHPRGDGSTAHVAPVPYDPMQFSRASGGYVTPQLSRRTKLLLAGVGLAVLTGIVTAAVVKSSAKPKAAATTAGSASKAIKAEPDKQPVAKTRPTVEPIVTPAKQEPAKQEPAKQEPAKQPDATSVIKQEPTKQVVKQEPTKQEPTKQEPTKQVVKQEPAKQQPVKQEVKAQPTKQVVKQEPKVVKQPERRTEPKSEPKVERKRESRRDTPSRRVATRDTSDARDKAEDLYRDRKFSAASSVLAAAAKSASGDEAKELRYKAELYAKLGRVYAKGTAPAQRASTAYEFLQQASTYDRNLGNAFDGDIQTRLAALAPKAAIAYLAAKQYPRARNALIAAQRYGSSDSNLGLVKQKLEAVAGELYNEAAKQMRSDPSGAKEKLRQVKSIVGGKSQWAVKADALLKRS